MKVHEGGGIEHEQENIEVLELPFELAMEMIDTGEIKDGKTAASICTTKKPSIKTLILSKICSDGLFY